MSSARKRFQKYFILEEKRMLLSLPKLLFGSLILLLLLSAALYVFQTSSEQKAEEETIHIGMVAEKDEPFLDWAIDVIEEMPDLGYSFTITRLDKKEAETAFQDKKANILLLIPKNYIRSLISGKNPPVTIQFEKGQASFDSFMMKELCKAASSYILDTDAIIYSMQDYYKEYNLPNDKKDELQINLQYITEVVAFRDGIEEIQADSASHSSSSAYAASGVILFLFLWGIMLAPGLTAINTTFRKQLSLFGIGTIKQNFAKSISCLTGMLLSLFLFLILFALLQLKLALPLDDTILSTPAGYPLFLLAMLPILLCASCYTLLLCEFSGDSLSSILLCFFSVIFMGLFSGCFYPLTYLPDGIRKLSAFLPTLHAKSYFLSVLYGHFPRKDFLLLMTDGCLFFLLAAIPGIVTLPKKRELYQKPVPLQAHRNILSAFPLGFFLWTKRLFRRPIFVITLLFIPFFAFFVAHSENSKDAMLKVAVYTEGKSNSSLTKKILQELFTLSGKTVRFYPCEQKKDLMEDVKTQKAIAGYIFPENLEQRLEEYQQKKKPFLQVYRDEETVSSFILDEIILSELYGTHAFSVMEKFIRNKKTPVDTEYLKAHYEAYRSHKSLFEFSYADGKKDTHLNHEQFSVLLLQLRGINAIIILLTCIAGVFLWYEDREQTFYMVSGRKKKYFSDIFSILVPGFFAGILGYLSMYLSGITEAPLTEALALIGYLFAASCFTCLLRTVLPTKELYLAAIPFVITGSFLLCPVLVDLSLVSPLVKKLQGILPITHYLFAIHDKKSLLLLFLYGGICLLSTSFLRFFFKKDFQ